MQAYWLLDQNAFSSSQPAPIFMKMDALVLGGCPVVMMLPNKLTNPELVKELKAQSLEYVPIAFMDLHKISPGNFSVSGLGVAKQYQGKGLGKNMIYAGVKTAEINTLIIPTQLSNVAAHHAWLHLSPLELISSDVFHNEPDTIIYKAKIPKNKEEILNHVKTKEGTHVGFSIFKAYHENAKAQGKKVFVTGYNADGSFKYLIVNEIDNNRK